MNIVQRDNYNLFISILLLFGFTFPTNGTKTNYNKLTLNINSSKTNHNGSNKIRYLSSILSNLDKIINIEMYTSLTTIGNDNIIDENPTTSILSQYQCQLLTSMDLVQVIPQCLFGQTEIIVNECKKQNDFTVIAQLLSVVNFKLLAHIKQSDANLNSISNIITCNTIADNYNSNYTYPTSSFNDDEYIGNKLSVICLSSFVMDACNKAYHKTSHQAAAAILDNFAITSQIHAQIEALETITSTARYSGVYDNSTYSYNHLTTEDKIDIIIDKTAEWMVDKIFGNQVFENEFGKYNLKLDKQIMIKMKNDYKHQCFIPLLKAIDCVVCNNNHTHGDYNVKKLMVNDRLYDNIVKGMSELGEASAYVKHSSAHMILWNILDEKAWSKFDSLRLQSKLNKFNPIGFYGGNYFHLLSETRLIQRWIMRLEITLSSQREFKITQLCRMSNYNVDFVKENLAMWMINKHFGTAINRLKTENTNNSDLNSNHRKVLLENIIRDATELFRNAFDNYVEQYVNLLKMKTTPDLASIQKNNLLVNQSLEIATRKLELKVGGFYGKYPCCMNGPSVIFAFVLKQFPDSAHSIVTSILFGSSKIDDCIFDECNLTKYDCIQLKQIQNDYEKEYWQKLVQNTNIFRSIVKNQKYWQCFVCGKNNKSATMDVNKEKIGCTQESMSCNNDNCVKKGQSLNPLYFALKNKFHQFTVEKQHGLAFVKIFLKVKYLLYYLYS